MHMPGPYHMNTPSLEFRLQVPALQQSSRSSVNLRKADDLVTNAPAGTLSKPNLSNRCVLDDNHDTIVCLGRVRTDARWVRGALRWRAMADLPGRPLEGVASLRQLDGLVEGGWTVMERHEETYDLLLWFVFLGVG